MKEILAKRKLDGDRTIVLSEGCWAIIERRSLSKLKEPDSFPISCSKGARDFDIAIWGLV